VNLICYKVGKKLKIVLYLWMTNDCGMVKVNVDPGICGKPTTVIIDKTAPLTVKITLSSKCEHIDNMSKEMDQIDAYHECFKVGDKSQILEISARHCQHFGCPVPMAIIKGIEVALGVSEPKDVSVKISEDESKQDQ
jgi:hypothetical protein